MSNNESILLFLSASDLKKWMPEIARLYLEQPLCLGFDNYMKALVGRPRTTEDFAALLEAISCQSGDFHSLVRQYCCPPVEDWLTVNRIAKTIGCSYKLIKSILNEKLTIVSGQMREQRGNVYLCYPPFVVQQIRDIVNEFPLSQGWFTIAEIARAVGRSQKWVVTYIEEYLLDVGEWRKSTSGPIRMCYSPEVVEKIKKQQVMQNCQRIG